jgi:predicted adenylyl cyclase CyaB
VACEIEMKVWVEDWDQLRKRLHRTCRFLGVVRKEDHYYRHQSDTSTKSYGFRIRTGGPDTVVTYKARSTREGVERNAEHEFRVSDAGEFAGFATHIGCSEYFMKLKEGEEFESGGLTIGLFHVAGIGDFLEIEAIIDDDDPDRNDRRREAAVRQVRAFFESVGMARARVESRSYVELAAERSPHTD